MVDWSKTRAWSTGGYYARVFFNVRGREPEGIVAPDALDAEIDRLTGELEALNEPTVRAIRPRDAYRAVTGFAPELLLFFSDLDVRSLGTIGGPLHSAHNDPRARWVQPRLGRHLHRARRARGGARGADRAVDP